MNIEKYCSYFHDGTITHINVSGTEIIITMSSVQIEDFENEDDIILGKWDTIRGRLHLLNPQRILINDIVVSPGQLKYQYGTILDLDFFPKRIELNVVWEHEKENNFYQGIVFESVDYYFENLPYFRYADDCNSDDEGDYIGPIDS